MMAMFSYHPTHKAADNVGRQKQLLLDLKRRSEEGMFSTFIFKYLFLVRLEVGPMSAFARFWKAVTVMYPVAP